MIKPLLTALALVSPASAESVREWQGNAASNFYDIYVQIHEPTHPGAVATITFDNRPVHRTDETFNIDWNGIEVTVDLDWNVDHTQLDQITVYPPDGYAAVPPSLPVGEDDVGFVHIIKWLGI